MSITLEDFLGEYTVRQGTRGLSPQPLDYGAQIIVEPSTTQDDGALVRLQSPSGSSGPWPYLLIDSSLWAEQAVNPPTGPVQSAPLFTVISLYRDPAGSGFKSLYGLLVVGDPEQVGVFGAEGTGGNLPSS